MSKKRIFFATRAVGPPWDEASKNMVWELARRLDMHIVTLLTYKEQKDLSSNASIIFKKIYPLGANGSRNAGPLTLRQKIFFFVTFLFTKSSIFHFYFIPEIISSLIIRLSKRFKRGIFVQTIATPIGNKDAISTLAFGDAIVVQSDTSLNMLKKNGITNVRRIYPAVDTDRFRPGVESQTFRTELGIPMDRKVVLYPGNYYLGCNKELTDTVIEINKSSSHIIFIVACRYGFPGDLIDKKNMKDAFRTAGILNRVVFLDRVDNMIQLLALSDIIIFPVKKVHQKADIPLVLIEALSMEKPIIISDLPPLNEIMKDDVGETVPPGDVAALVHAIEKLLNNPVLRNKKGKRARELAKREFGIANYVAEYQRLYEEVLNLQ